MIELDVGEQAPDFELPTGPGETISLSEVLSGNHHAVVVFFPAVWSEVCSNEASVIEAVADEIRRLEAGIVGISADNHPATRAWADELGLSFPIASDFEPKGEVAKAWGVYHESGTCKRVQFIVDSDRQVVLSHVAPVGKSPGAQAILKKLEELSACG
jgi:peroxiredoxin